MSALERNFKARASSRRPRTTFTAFNQPPAFPILFSQLGKIANKAKGMAKATEKPSIPMRGPALPPLAANTNKLPIIGPVQEKETIVRVSAIKKIPPMVVIPDLESARVDQELGNWISNAPRKESPNNRKMTKKARLAQILLAS